MMKRILEYLNKHSKVLKRLFFAFLLVTVAYDFFAERHHAHFFGDSIIGFWAGFGILGCLGMIIVCKGLSHVWLEKEEEYYDK
jgi:drug/metabolite transporter (DMT)-like permease